MSEQAQEHGGNGPDGKVLGEMLKSHFRIEDSINSLRMRHAADVGALRKQQGEVRERVKGSGHNVRAFKVMVLEEHDRRRAANRLAKLDDEDRESVDMMRTALGPLADLPLGQAAVEQAEAKTKRADRKKQLNNELDSMGGAQASANAEAIQSGIKTKH